MAEKQNFYLDLVVCLDISKNMGNQIDFISDFLNRFYDVAKTEVQNSVTKVQQVRIKIITFSDYNQEEPLCDYGFLNMPDQSVELFQLLESLPIVPEFKQEGLSNGLEALCLAMDSEFVDLSNANGRQSVVVFSTNKPFNFEDSQGEESYPSNFPKTLMELKNKWEKNKVLDKNKKMLTLFCNLDKGKNSWYPLEKWDKVMAIHTDDINEYTNDFILETILIDII